MPKKAGSKKKKEDDDVVGEEVEEIDTKKGKKRAAKDSDDDVDEKPAKKAKAKTAAKPTPKAKKGKGKAKEEDEEGEEKVAVKPKVVADAAYFENPKKAAGQLKIVSWNVAGFKAVLGKGLLDYLKNEDPDIICLQETKIKEEAALASNLPDNYHSYFNTCSNNAGYAGVGLMSKIKPIAVTKGIGTAEHDIEGRVLTAEYDKFYLISSYVPNSGQKLEKLDYRVKEWDIAMQAYLKKLEEKKPVIWCGDLNVAHKEIDLKNPKTNKKTAGFTQQERDSFTKILDSGFVDAHRHFYPDQEGAFTFWSYKNNARENDVGWRLDYFIVSKSFMGSVVDSIIRTPIRGSDHCPILLLVKS